MGDWGWVFGGSLFFWGEGKGGRRFVIFVYLLTIPLVGNSLLGAFFFSFSFLFGNGGFFVFIFLLFALFFFFFSSAFSIFLMKLRLPPP